MTAPVKARLLSRLGSTLGARLVMAAVNFGLSLPLHEGGPGNGQWNLGQYVVARGSDLPLHDLEIEVLPPISADEPPKGIAEVVMIPVVPAILNAIFDATGHRFDSLPVTPSMLKGALA